MPRDETRGEIDLSLSIEGIKQSDADLLRICGQVIERLAAIARNAGWRYIEIASKVERHRSVQNATHRLDVAIPVGCPNSLYGLVDGIGVSENVVGRLPIGVFIGGPEACQPERRRVGEGTPEVASNSARPDRRLKSIHDRHRDIAEKRLSKRRMIRPAVHVGPGGEQTRQLGGSFCAQRDEVERLAPGGRLLGTASCHRLAYHGGQDGVGMLPPDQVEALESFVCEIKRVSPVGERAVRIGRKQEVGERGWRGASGDGGEQSALGRFAMAHRCPAPQPALKGREIGPARESNTSPPRRLAVAIRRNAASAVEQGEVGLLLRQNRQEIAERNKDRQANVPTVAVLDPEQRDLPHDIGWRHAGRELAVRTEAVGSARLRLAECWPTLSLGLEPSSR